MADDGLLTLITSAWCIRINAREKTWCYCRRPLSMWSVRAEFYLVLSEDLDLEKIDSDTQSSFQDVLGGTSLFGWLAEEELEIPSELDAATSYALPAPPTRVAPPPANDFEKRTNELLAKLEGLAEQGVDEITDIEELDEKKAGELIMAARNIVWFNEE